MQRPVTTFSIVALDEDTGDLGVAVQPKFLAVGAVVPWARAGAGAIAAQAWADLEYGPTGLDPLPEGLSAAKVMAHLVEADEGRAKRQLGMVDAPGAGRADP
jgi:uncharacterized Ntn-hydrolase superfamily protein